MGAPSTGILKIFVIEGVVIGVVGTVLGTISGLVAGLQFGKDHRLRRKPLRIQDPFQRCLLYR